LAFSLFGANNCGAEDLWEKRTERRKRILRARENNGSEDPPLQRLIGKRIDISDGDEAGEAET